MANSSFPAVGAHAGARGNSAGNKSDTVPPGCCSIVLRPIGRRQGFESKTHASLHARKIEPFARRPFTKLEVSKRPKRTDLSLDLEEVTPERERGV